VNQSGFTIVSTTIATAAVHTLIPDHWLPFVLVARAERWGVRHTIWLTTLSGLLHVAVSVAIAVALVFAGRRAESALEWVEASGEALSGWLLVLFGLAYMLWFLLRGGHVHSFGMHPHHEPAAASGKERPPAFLSGYALAFVVGFNPCVLVVPLAWQAAEISWGALGAVVTAFALTTMTTMVGVTWLGLRGTARLDRPFLARYGEAVSGGLIALTGAAILVMR